MKGYEEYEDLPDDATILVYSLEEILTEKVVALADRARNGPRDLYDDWYLTELKNMELNNGTNPFPIVTVLTHSNFKVLSS